jgi:uncharacterized protein with HEPN domain
MNRKLDYEDYEGEMAKSQLMKIENYARKLNEMIHPEDELEAWVQSKLSVIDAYMGDIKHYLDYQLKEMGEGGFDDEYEDSDDRKNSDGYFMKAMEDAKEYVGEEKWETFSDDEKIQVTKYLKMKGRVGYKKGGVTSSSWGAIKYDADIVHLNPIEDMEDAKEYVGEEKWQTFSDDEKIQITKYLKIKGRRTLDKYKKISDSTSENKFPEINRRK